MNRKCSGCGAILQCVNPNEMGYVRIDKMDIASYCERCFKIIHYGKTLVVDEPKDIDSIIKIVNKEIKHSLFLVDIFNLNESTINTYKKINGSKTLIISKSDLFRNVIKENVIKNLLRNYYDVKDNIIFISTISGEIKELMNYLESNHIYELYVLGYINSGKSSLINHILSFNNQEIKGLTTSYIPHTTMDFITIEVNDHLKLIDSPGFTMNSILTDNINLLKKINSRCHIRPLTYQMKVNEIIAIEDFIAIKTFTKTSFTLYINNSLSTKKVYKLIDYNKIIELDIPQNSDLVIKGIGFINIKLPAKIAINISDDSLIELRPSLFGGPHE